MLFLNSCEFHTFLIKKSQNFVQSMQGDEHTKDEYTNSHTNTHTNDNRPQLFSPTAPWWARFFLPWWARFFLTFKGLSSMKDTFSPPGAAAPGPPLFFPRGCRPWTPLLLLAMRPVAPAFASGRQLVPVVANWCQKVPEGARGI